MPIDAWEQLIASPLGLVVMAATVYGDAFLVLLPGEVAVTAMGAIAVDAGRPPLGAVVAVAWAAALAGDVSCYGLGRATRVRDRVRGRLRVALEWADEQLRRRGAAILFTARFVPFARLGVNLAAGASRTPVRTYLPLVAAASLGWALFQAVIGAAVALIVPGGTVVAVVVSIAAAVVLGLALDTTIAAVRRARSRHADGDGR